MLREVLYIEVVFNFFDRYFIENCDYMLNFSVWYLILLSCKVDVF